MSIKSYVDRAVISTAFNAQLARAVNICLAQKVYGRLFEARAALH